VIDLQSEMRFQVLLLRMQRVLAVLPLLLIALNSRPLGQRPKEGLVVIPGLGNVDRVKAVAKNLQLLSHKLNNSDNDATWDCVIYVYAVREPKVSPTSAWADVNRMDFISKLCKVIENPGKLITENQFMVQAPLIRLSYQYVFILFDDCELLGESEFDLDRVLGVMEYNHLTLASPLVTGANTGGGQDFRRVMQTEAPIGTEGWESTFVEMFAWVLTMPAYEALWELYYPSLNPYGWGFDLWYQTLFCYLFQLHNNSYDIGNIRYDNYAKQKVVGHKMGIVTTVKTFHFQTNMRSDNTDVKVKWKALELQEAHYKMYYNIRLRWCRENLNLKNHSWNGAVVDLLHSPPDGFRLQFSSRPQRTKKKVRRTHRSRGEIGESSSAK